jgi:dienelactone hydrolase
MNGYPFARGPFPVGVRTIEARDVRRARCFPVEIWFPAVARYAGLDLAPEIQDVFQAGAGQTPRRQAAVRDAAVEAGRFPLIVFSHHSGGGRRAATFLQTHLASHGYVVAAMDHSELVAPELAFKAGDAQEGAAAHVEAIVSNRVPDIRFLIDHLLHHASGLGLALDPDRIGAAGHSFGGWTVLAAAETEPRIKALVALAPGGSSRRKPGILPLPLTFDWARDVPTLYLVAEDDASLPLDGMRELFERTRATKRMVILRRADHLHFVDDVEGQHEVIRTTPMVGELAWLNRDMKPIAELCPGGEAHLFTRSLALCHLDWALKGQARASRFLSGDIAAQLAAAGVACSVA